MDKEDKEIRNSSSPSQHQMYHVYLIWAPWCGGQFERMVDLGKGISYEAVGKSKLEWKELEEALTDMETTLNNRPLTVFT